MSVDDLDNELRRRFAALRAEDRKFTPPLRLDPARAARQEARRMRLAPRPAMAAAAALFAAISVGALITMRQPGPPDQMTIALQPLPSTDWLLDTPRAEDVARLQNTIEKELINEN